MTMSGCRVLQQLREYSPRQTRICSFDCNIASPSRPPPVRRFQFGTCSRRLFRFKLLSTNALNSSSSSSSSSSSCVTNIIHGLPNDVCAHDASKPPVLSDCLTPAENDDRDSPMDGISWLAGGIVALGKFDALHIGHRELAIQAAKIGVPFLLSFIGMSEILGWEPRDPIVAKYDRRRVLSSWAPLCGNVIPEEFHIEFSKVRNLTPRQFVEKLSKELRVGGVVAGQNYRFGYRASGDSSDLVRLCEEYGMKACIVNYVMDKKSNQQDSVKDIIDCCNNNNNNNNNSTEHGQVSSTRVRHALANGDMAYVSELLGRHHRLILMVLENNGTIISKDRNKLSAHRSCLSNLSPDEGIYKNCSLVIGGENVVVPCRVVIDTRYIHVEFDELLAPHININAQHLGIDFGDTRA